MAEACFMLKHVPQLHEPNLVSELLDGPGTQKSHLGTIIARAASASVKAASEG